MRMNAGLLGCASLTDGYVSTVTSNSQSYNWATNQANPATINPQSGTRNAACWFGDSYAVQVTLANQNDLNTHRMAHVRLPGLGQ